MRGTLSKTLGNPKNIGSTEVFFSGPNSSVPEPVFPCATDKEET